MKAHHIILATTLVALAFNGASADNKKNAKTKTAKPAAEQQVPVENYEQKIAAMQQSIAQLRADIDKIKNERSELQVKLEQSDKEIAAQMQKIEDIKKKLSEKTQEAEALEARKKP
jgi:predicted RNase H-like nuclease (RuvC/YqgF family)